jgi:hypothetical protein
VEAVNVSVTKGLALMIFADIVLDLIRDRDFLTKNIKIIKYNNTQSIVMGLPDRFAIDSFAGGFMIQSIVSFWFFTRFGADLTTLSYILR